MLITPSNLNLFFTALDTRYSQAFQSAEVWNEQIATVYPCGTEAWQMGWLGMLDKLRMWKGARQTRTPAPQTYSAVIQPFELTEAIDKFKIQDDSHGIYMNVVSHMGVQAKKWPDYQVRDLIEAQGDYSGTQPQLGTDGIAHWSGVHPVDFYDSSKGTYANDYGAAGTAINSVTVGGAFSSNAWATVYQDHSNRKNESNEKIGVLSDLTMVPTYLAFAGKTVLQAQFFSPSTLTGMTSQTFVGNIDNPLRGSNDLMINVDLISQAGWYQLTTKKVIKPFGFVLRQAPTLTPRMDPTDPAVFDAHQFIYGLEARGVPVWSLPWLSSRSGI